MRTIRFRGKRMSDGEWLYGYLNEALSLIKVNNDVSNLRIGRSFVRTSTIGQFTGLHDKNGKEIYEGDILLWTRKNVHIEGRPLRDFADRCEIFYDDDKCAFRFQYKLDCGSCSGLLDFRDDRADESYIEIIGNIHDNPELQKGGEQ